MASAPLAKSAGAASRHIGKICWPNRLPAQRGQPAATLEKSSGPRGQPAATLAGAMLATQVKTGDGVHVSAAVPKGPRAMPTARVMPSVRNRVSFPSIGKLAELFMICTSQFSWPDADIMNSYENPLRLSHDEFWKGDRNICRAKNESRWLTVPDMLDDIFFHYSL